MSNLFLEHEQSSNCQIDILKKKMINAVQDIPSQKKGKTTGKLRGYTYEIGYYDH